MKHSTYDVVIVGGGPGGSTCASFIRKYNPSLKVAIFERAVFPREHVGESQLPIISQILDEMGAWEKVEAAGFPVKIGATYRWGLSDDLWDFNFLPHGDFKDVLRPGKYQGQRRETAFQVDRAKYDKILLDHAKELGCEVHEGTGVREVKKEGDRITGLVLANGDTVEGKYYIDGSGHVGFLRRAMGVGVEEPSNLQNIAIWDYWQNAEWAVSLGVGGTRVQVMSLGYGWIWFIPISETRTSIGLVCPAEYYKKSGLKPEQLYLKAISDEKRISALTADAQRENLLESTKDWSFVAERMTGENWILVGEAAGFADPVLAAGLTLTQLSAKEAALTILEAERGEDLKWLLESYQERNERKVRQHIRFADYWYTANAHFSELKEYTREIAKDAGLDLDANAAFRWLGTGGFVEDDMEVGGIAGFGLGSIHTLTSRFSGGSSNSSIDSFSGFELLLDGAELLEVPVYDMGRVHRIQAYKRGGKTLPLTNIFGALVTELKKSPRLDVAVTQISRRLAQHGVKYDQTFHARMLYTLEAMERDGWVKCLNIPGASPITVQFGTETAFIESNRDMELYEDRVAAALKAPLVASGS